MRMVRQRSPTSKSSSGDRMLTQTPALLPATQAGVSDEAAYKQALDILIPMGEYFQVQDDVLDAFAPPEVLGKIGTDIQVRRAAASLASYVQLQLTTSTPIPLRCTLQDNKCSWPINLALSLASPAQRQTLDVNYGVRSAETEAKVKAVYAELDIQAKFDAYEAKSYREINEAIEQVDEAKTGLKREVFRSFLAKVYKRTK